MISKANNIEQSNNKSRTEKSGSNVAGSKGKKNSTRKTGGFFGFLSSQEDPGSGTPKRSPFPVNAGEDALASLSLLPGLNVKHDNNSQPQESGKQLQKQSARMPAINNFLSVPAKGADSSPTKHAYLKSPKPGKDIKKVINELASKLNAGEIRFEKKTVDKGPDNPVELIRNLSSGKNISTKAVNKLKIGEGKEEVGENLNPLHNSVIKDGEKAGTGRTAKAEKLESFLAGDKQEKGFAESFLHLGKSPDNIQPGRMKVSSLDSYSAYGPVHIEEFGRTVFNMATNMADETVHTAKLTLKPESLGTVFVEISMIENTASINIKADTRETAKIIENQLASLKDRLSQQGIDTGRIEVSLSQPDNDLLDHNSNSDAGGQTPHEEQQTRRLYASSFRHLKDRGETGDFLSYVQD